ncbi:MAG TPA: DNA-formamidopyrimidine glycosylase family protein [Microthrixaceae bacterium]|nr:DNA-formamidopyrimidine glycosylase family protein [Microthrixaceae bacterium]
MPELPEVRAQAARLDDLVAGHTLTGFRPLSFTALKTVLPDPGDAVGHPVDHVRSRGKHLLIEVAGLTFVVHLMQGGRLEPDEKQSPKPRGGLARWTFADRAVLLTEAGREHKAGVWVVSGDPEGQEPLTGLGPDADTIDRDTLAGLARARSGRLHGFLRDQRELAGLGRRLANEICHLAFLSPFANTSKLTDEELDRLHEAIGVAIIESLEYEATQDHMTRSKERPSAVHHREGQECPVCGDTIRAVEYRAYVVNYCANCQTGGKVLADNTTSKFLK